MNTTPNKSAHQYDALFYRYQREGSLRSARAVLPLVREINFFRSILDIGCGAGAWLSVAHELGVTDICGIDGDYVDRSLLLIDPSHFVPHDISQPFDHGRSYDIVMCLEVAEHLPNKSSAILVDNLVKHSKIILFSAAVPGQGGENHINEQPYHFWHNLFDDRGYQLFDCIRPHIANNSSVEPWYRYNLLLFVHEETVSTLPKNVTMTHVKYGQHIRDFSPITYRARKLLLRNLPNNLMTKLAVWRHQHFVRSLQRQARRLR